MPTHDDDDLDLLLSLRVPETPPGSPSHPPQPHSPGYLSDEEGSPRRRRGDADMSVFRDAVKDYLTEDPIAACDAAVPKPSKHKGSSDVEVEKFSGLRIRNSLVSQVESNNHFSDVRFIRITAIRNLMSGDTISGCWATVGVLTEKGDPRLSSTGKSFCVWKLGDLDESNVSVFLFGDAYTNYSEAPIGTVFALFNSAVRKDNSGKGFSLSVYSTGQILKMGTSVDYSVCRGKRKDGLSCTMVINKRQGVYCKYHASNASLKYCTSRTELKGGNLRTAFRPRTEGIYMVDPLKDRANSTKTVHAVKVLSVDGLKRALRKADKVTTNSQSQGIRFLTEVTAKLEPDKFSRGSRNLSQIKTTAVKRRSSAADKVPSIATADYLSNAKRKKIHNTEKVIELDVASSD